MSAAPLTGAAAPRDLRRIGYLGPAGTFSELALRARPEAATAQAVPCGSVDAALAAVRSGDVDAAVVPIENSVEGGVPATLDALATGEPLVVVGEMLVPVSFVLGVLPGMTVADVRTVSTHSHAWAQVRRWMAVNLPDAGYVPATSTAAAAVDLAAGARPGEPGAGFEGAVCLRMAAVDHGLEILADDIGDNREAVTRFVLVARPGRLPEPSGADKTTLVLYQEADHPGGLLGLLEQFSARGINLTRLESRPTGESLGRYCFSIDLEGHVRDDRVAEAMLGLHRVAAGVRFLGSYPRADARAATVPAEHDADSYREARAWLAALGAG